jgi:hypothetical protein
MHWRLHIFCQKVKASCPSVPEVRVCPRLWNPQSILNQWKMLSICYFSSVSSSIPTFYALKGYMRQISTSRFFPLLPRTGVGPAPDSLCPHWRLGVVCPISGAMLSFRLMPGAVFAVCVLYERKWLFPFAQCVDAAMSVLRRCNAFWFSQISTGYIILSCGDSNAFVLLLTSLLHRHVKVSAVSSSDFCFVMWKSETVQKWMIWGFHALSLLMLIKVLIQSLHLVDKSSVADVSEIFAATTFRVEMNRASQYLYTYIQYVPKVSGHNWRQVSGKLRKVVANLMLPVKCCNI